MTRHTRSPLALAAAGVAAALLAGCAGQPATVVMEGPAPQQVQTTTVPKGTFLGGASAGEATALAQMVATSNNKTMQAFERVGGQMNQLQATEDQELKNSQDALARLEQLSLRQGAGEVTLFFAEAPLPVIGQYRVNIPHQMFKVSSVGDMYAPKHATAAVEARYQSVRLISAFDAAQLPK